MLHLMLWNIMMWKNAISEDICSLSNLPDYYSCSLITNRLSIRLCLLSSLFERCHLQYYAANDYDDRIDKNGGFSSHRLYLLRSDNFRLQKSEFCPISFP